MLTDSQQELLTTRPERFSYLTIYLPEFCALDMSRIVLELYHKGRYLAESDLSGRVILDPHTPLGPLVNLGTVGGIANTLDDPSEFLAALEVIFSTLNTYATNKVRSDPPTIL